MGIEHHDWMDPSRSDDVLRRHAPDRPDDARLAEARAGLDAAIGRGTGPGAGVTGAAARARQARVLRVMTPVAAAVVLGVVFVLWPSPSAPSAFADWSPSPGPGDVGVETTLVLQCQERATTAQLTLAAARAEAEAKARSRLAAQLDEVRGQEAATEETGPEETATADGLDDVLDPVVVDSRGSWTYVVLGGGSASDGTAFQVECLLDSSGAGDGSLVAVMEWTADSRMVDGDDAVDPFGGYSYSVTDGVGWTAVTGGVPEGTSGVVLHLTDGTTVEATVSDPPPRAADSPGGALDRPYAAWWPTTTAGPFPETIELRASDGRVSEHAVEP
ncbi:MAG: hypothetical protein J0H73_07955 [Salana multivorans]|nr:hypothetical protein [Salana multivorans]